MYFLELEILLPQPLTAGITGTRHIPGLDLTSNFVICDLEAFNNNNNNNNNKSKCFCLGHLWFKDHHLYSFGTNFFFLFFFLVGLGFEIFFFFYKTESQSVAQAYLELST
jgi:hypothetical protein